MANNSVNVKKNEIGVMNCTINQGTGGRDWKPPQHIHFQMLRADTTFSNRSEELEKLERLIGPGETGQTRVAVLSTEGRAGKSQLLAHHWERHKEQYQDNAIWLQEAPGKSLTDNIKQLAIDLRIPVGQSGEARSYLQVVSDIRRWLLTRRALLVFENARPESAAAVQEFLAAIHDCQGVKVLLTSVHDVWPGWSCMLLEKYGWDKVHPAHIQFQVPSARDKLENRDEDLLTLDSLIEPARRKNARQTRTVVYNGEHRIGKTELVAKYCELFKKQFDNNIVWINKPIQENVTRLAIQLNILTEGRDIQSVITHIKYYFLEKKALVVLDDVRPSDVLMLAGKEGLACCPMVSLVATSTSNEWFNYHDWETHIFYHYAMEELANNRWHDFTENFTS